MNIFEVLNKGKSRLNEPSISAFIGYLLQTNENHGLSDIFLRKILVQILNNNENLCKCLMNKDYIESEVLLEESYIYGENKVYIDILLNLEIKTNEYITIIIENKISANSAKKEQLKQYYDAVRQDTDDSITIYFVFITPENDNRGKLKESYDYLENMRFNDEKFWITWDNKNGIISLLTELLSEENMGKINPLNEYLKHTIKAFIKYMTDIINEKSVNKKIRVGEDIGDVIEEINYNLNEEELVIIMRKSGQIQVYKENEKVTAKEYLRKIIDKEDLQIEKVNINTRMMGKKVIDELKKLFYG
jgi:hypothetical protein